MSTSLKVILGFITLGFLSIIFMGLSVMSSYNNFIYLEKNIVAQYEQNKNNYDNMWKKFKESVQVSEIFVTDLEKVYKSAIEGRYGENGSQAVFQMLKEHNPNLDASIYKRIQETIESGRNDFEENQKLLIDKKRMYQTQLEIFPKNIIAGFFGFPRLNLDQFGIVTSNKTESVFETKKDDEIKLK